MVPLAVATLLPTATCTPLPYVEPRQIIPEVDIRGVETVVQLVGANVPPANVLDLYTVFVRGVDAFDTNKIKVSSVLQYPTVFIAVALVKLPTVTVTHVAVVFV